MHKKNGNLCHQGGDESGTIHFLDICILNLVKTESILTARLPSVLCHCHNADGLKGVNDKYRKKSVVLLEPDACPRLQ